uniref:Uncharacterized protein n=1 Tax=Lactuca sativa TaxID=4236 RepID=A0A9R1W5W3_LACSA|nr:hypothetical protein LSAT_V11C300128270 [Lactuca sativa]
MPTRKAFPYVKVWLKLKYAPKWIQQTEGTSKTSSVQETQMQLPTNQADEHISTSMMIRSILKTSNLFIGPLEEVKQKNRGRHHFGDKFDQYVQVQENKVEILNQWNKKIIEAQTSFQEA